MPIIHICYITVKLKRERIKKSTRHLSSYRQPLLTYGFIQKKGPCYKHYSVAHVFPHTIMYQRVSCALIPRTPWPLPHWIDIFVQIPPWWGVSQPFSLKLQHSFTNLTVSSSFLALYFCVVCITYIKYLLFKSFLSILLLLIGYKVHEHSTFKKCVYFTI